MLFIAGIAMVLMVGTVWIARVCLANATMEVLADTAQITRATEAARAEGARLEVQYAIATNPSSIQEAAASQLGMSPDSQVDYLRASSGE
jgi:cell division protein FtsL